MPPGGWGGGLSWRLHIVTTVKARGCSDNLSPKTSELISAGAVSICNMMYHKCSPASQLILAVPNQHLSQQRKFPPPQEVYKKLPLQVFALFSFSLVPLSKHCSKSHFHWPRQGAPWLQAPFLLYLVLYFL